MYVTYVVVACQLGQTETCDRSLRLEALSECTMPHACPCLEAFKGKHLATSAKPLPGSLQDQTLVNSTP